MSLTPRDARIKLYDHPVIGPGLGLYGTATSLAPTALTDVLKLGSGLYGPNTFNGLATVVLPNRTGTDREKVAGALAAGGILAPAPTTNTWPSASDEPYEIIWGAGRKKLTISHLVEAGRLAMREVYFNYSAPVSPWKTATGVYNGDFSEGVSDWTASGASLSVTQSDDPTHSDSGFSSMLLYNNAGVDRYVYHSRGIPVQPGGSVWMAVILKVVELFFTLGTEVEVSFWDSTDVITGLTQIGETMSGGGLGTALHMGQQLTIPAGCTRLNMRITLPSGVTAAVDCLPGHDLADMVLAPPDWIKANFQLHSISDVNYGRQIIGQRWVETAKSGYPYTWEPRIDYAVLNEAESANPGSIQILKGPGRRVVDQLPARDLWFAGLRQESDRVPFNSESDVFNGSEDMFMAAYRKQVAEMLEGRDELGANGKWRVLQRESQTMLDTQRIVREQRAIVAPEPRRRTLAV